MIEKKEIYREKTVIPNVEKTRFVSRKQEFPEPQIPPPPPLLEKTPLVCVLFSLWSLVRNSEIIE